MTRLTDKKSSDAINTITLTQKRSSVVLNAILASKDRKSPRGQALATFTSPVNWRAVAGGATDPVWSLEVYRLGCSVTKPNEPVLYYLQGDDAPQRGFVREERLAVPSDTQLPPDEVLRR